jgi:predicted PurR-regulated permease PerM
MLIIGVMSYIGLRLLGIEFALPLAILAGILEIVPNIGPVLSAIPAILAGLVISPLMGLAVAALYFLVQQLENTLIVPQIMAREIGVRPLVVIISLAIGVELGGFIGVVLAIPFMLLLRITASEFFSSKRLKKL